MSPKKVEINLLFETSWEVCNKVGGIYTVLSTKAKRLQELYPDKVVFVGPDVWDAENPCPVFAESKTLFKKWRGSSTLPYDIKVRMGRWKVPGRPIAVLVDFDGMYADKNGFYAELWARYGVDSLHAYGDYDEGCAFARAAAIVIDSLSDFLQPEGRTGGVVAHFDEWTTGAGLLELKTLRPDIATIFTTHATSIGRSICGNGKNLYQYFRGYNGDQMARELNMEAKHSLEKAAAHNADCFTTVSDITALECEQLLDKRPDKVTPNGFEPDFVPEGKTFDSRRKTARRRLLGVATALTGVDMDDDTFIVATAGRCEYRNKGLDLFIDSMDRLGHSDTGLKVLAYVMVPAWSAGPRGDLAHNIAIKSRERLRNPYLTHHLHNNDSDSIASHLRRSDFRNEANSRVVCIYVPCYLNGDDGIFDKSYYDLLIGMDATVFPSYYEPWGYTPLESVAFGVPTVTTSLSGFGQWVETLDRHGIENTGVAVIERDDTNYDAVRDSIAATLKQLVADKKARRDDASRNAMATSALATWQYFIACYVDAFRIALDNARKRNT